MKWFEKLERKLGRYAIKNLMLYLIVIYAIGTLIFLTGNYAVYYLYLAMSPADILHGQVWRLITFLMMPADTSNIFFMILSLYVYWNLGMVIEKYWGSFRFNVYIFTGILGTIIGSFICYAIYGDVTTLTLMNVGPTYLNFSLFLAYAITFPDAQFLLFFIIPIKAKYLGIIEAVIYVYMFVAGAVQGNYATCVMIVTSLINVIIFFLLTRNLHRFTPGEIKRKKQFKKAVTSIPRGNRHKCCVCGKTDEDGDDLVFRFCSKCEGNYEYCQDHLYTHTHVTKADAEKIHTI